MPAAFCLADAFSLALSWSGSMLTSVKAGVCHGSCSVGLIVSKAECTGRQSQSLRIASFIDGLVA